MMKTDTRSLYVTRAVEYLSGRVEWKRDLDASLVLTCGNHHDLTIFIVEHSWPGPYAEAGRPGSREMASNKMN